MSDVVRGVLAVCAAGLGSWVVATDCAAQDGPAGMVELHVEAIAGGVTLVLPAGRAWSVGIDVSVGNHLGIDLTDEGRDLDTFVTGYPVVRWRPAHGWQATVGPIGFAAVVGNDFGVVYPSAQAGLARYWRRLGIGSSVRVVRIAGGNGTGQYQVQWVPAQLRLRV